MPINTPDIMPTLLGLSAVLTSLSIGLAGWWAGINELPQLRNVVLALSAIVAQAEPFKVGFVYVGPVGDYGWSYRHNEGRKAIEAAFVGMPFEHAEDLGAQDRSVAFFRELRERAPAGPPIPELSIPAPIPDAQH